MSAAHSPRVAFGLAATSVALKAREGFLRNRDRLMLAEICLTQVNDDAKVCEAVATFIRDSFRDPVAAGSALQDFILTWTDAIDPKRTEETLKNLKTEFQHYDWQSRADLQ